MKQFVKDHYGKAVAFLTGWATESYAGLSGYLNQILVVLGVK
jgi:hypothetical protein